MTPPWIPNDNSGLKNMPPSLIKLIWVLVWPFPISKRYATSGSQIIEENGRPEDIQADEDPPPLYETTPSYEGAMKMLSVEGSGKSHVEA